MATKIIHEDQFKGQTANYLLSSALSAIEEGEAQKSQVYAVASAARAYCGEGSAVEGSLFEAIETLLEGSAATNALRRYVTELARRAGAEVANGAQHG